MKIMHRGKHWVYQFLYKCTDLMKMISSQRFFLSEFVKTGKCYMCNYTSILRKQRNLSLQQVGKEKLITKVCSVHIFNRRCFGIQLNILKYFNNYNGRCFFFTSMMTLLYFPYKSIMLY